MECMEAWSGWHLSFSFLKVPIMCIKPPQLTLLAPLRSLQGGHTMHGACTLEVLPPAPLAKSLTGVPGSATPDFPLFHSSR